MVVINSFLKEGIFPEDLNSSWYSKKYIFVRTETADHLAYYEIYLKDVWNDLFGRNFLETFREKRFSSDFWGFLTNHNIQHCPWEMKEHNRHKTKGQY